MRGVGSQSQVPGMGFQTRVWVWASVCCVYVFTRKYDFMCVHASVCVHIYVCVYMYTCPHLCMCVHVYVYACLQDSMTFYKYAQVRVCSCVCVVNKCAVELGVLVCACQYMYLHACMCMYMSVYTCAHGHTCTIACCTLEILPALYSQRAVYFSKRGQHFEKWGLYY